MFAKGLLEEIYDSIFKEEIKMKNDDPQMNSPTKNTLLFIIFLQYTPRFYRIFLLTSELQRTSGVFAETSGVGEAFLGR